MAAARRRSIRLPPEVCQQLWATAHLAGLPVQEVIRVALVHFAKLDHGSKVGILGECWYRGQYATEPRGLRQPLRPAAIACVWDEAKQRWHTRERPEAREGGWCAVARARVARWCRWLAGARGTDDGPAKK